MFSIAYMEEIHPTFERFMQVAKVLKGINTQAELARELRIPEQSVTNWKTRGVPKDKLIDLADEWGFRIKYVRDGEGDIRPDLYSFLDSKQAALLEVREKLPDWAQDEILSSAIKTAELIEKAKASDGKN